MDHLTRKSPDHRASDVYEYVETSSDLGHWDHRYKEAYARLLSKQGGVPREVQEAFLIYLNGFKREVVEAFFVAGGDKRDIHDVFNISMNTIEAYRYLFFDIDVFKDRLDLYEYVHNYETDENDGFGEDIKRDALDHGLDYMKASYGGSEFELSEIRILKDTIKQAYLLSKSARKNDLHTEAAKEARQWTSTMIDAISSLPDVQEYEEEQEDVAIELVSKDQTNKKDLSDAEIISSPEDIED